MASLSEISEHSKKPLHIRKQGEQLDLNDNILNIDSTNLELEIPEEKSEIYLSNISLKTNRRKISRELLEEKQNGLYYYQKAKEGQPNLIVKSHLKQKKTNRLLVPTNISWKLHYSINTKQSSRSKVKSRQVSDRLKNFFSSYHRSSQSSTHLSSPSVLISNEGYLNKIERVDKVDISPPNGESSLLTSFGPFAFVGIVFAVVILTIWIKKVTLYVLTNTKLVEFQSNNIVAACFFKQHNKTSSKEKPLNHPKAIVLKRPALSYTFKIMDINAEEFKDRCEKKIESNESTPYFTPVGEFDDNLTRFEYPLLSPSCSKKSSNVDLILPIATDSTSNSAKLFPTRTPTGKLVHERRPCTPPWSYMAYLLSNNSVSKTAFDYEHIFSKEKPVHSSISTLPPNSSPTRSLNPVDVVVFNKQISSSNFQSCHTPNIYENRAVDLDGDKENEIPQFELSRSPKLKSDLIQFQSNSPLPLDTLPTIMTKFSFSPKHIDRSEKKFVGIVNIKSSPTLSSAGYTNGDYFKFPEVDRFSPVINKINQSTSHFENEDISQSVLDKQKKLNSSDSPSTRRARLKSISLDSQGAKLVEDNLGIPVKELIVKNTTAAKDFYASNTTLSNSSQGQQDAYNQKTKLVLQPPETRKNCESASKNREILANTDCNNCNNKYGLLVKVGNRNDSYQNLPQQELDFSNETPKTPILGQTKPKAVSFDSSDSKESSSRHFFDDQHAYESGTHKEQTQKAVSLLQISSASMPGTCKGQLSFNKGCNHNNRLAKSSSSQNSKGRQFSSCKSLTPSISSNSAFELSKSSDRQSFILKLDSFNENGLDDGDYEGEIGAADEADENFFLNFDETAVAYEDDTSEHMNVLKPNSLDDEDSSLFSVATRKISSDFLIGSSITTLSLSNSNLKTLPEVMTLSDFSMSHQYGDYNQEYAKGSGPAQATKQPNLLAGRSARSSLLQRRGSNHSLTLNLNSSYGSLSKGMSASNYSLCSNSQYNLSNLSQHHPLKTGQSMCPKNSSAVISAFGYNPNNIHSTGAAAISCLTDKKTLLQRRGSNTSLTLNIHDSPCVHLNRFNSHSSLNIVSQQPPIGSLVQQNGFKDPTNLSNENVKGKKGLLERRGSNASLTINLQCNALAISNLRGSACSLSSINTTQLEEEYEHHGNHDSRFLSNSVSVGQQRKFFSYEDLNNLHGRTQYSKLNQTHMRSSTKTCFGSVSDLKPHSQLPLSSLYIGEERDINYKNTLFDNKPTQYIHGLQSINLQNVKQITTQKNISSFEQSPLCSCTGLRNITTKPLSPQTTSEDFKLYLANVQLLQNASNVLDEKILMKLSYVFDKSYGHKEMSQTEKFEDSKWQRLQSSIYGVDLPDELEQKCLIRNLHQEFWDLPTNHQEKPMVFGSQSKNRYKSILPNEHSRVQLSTEEGCIRAPYINANYIKGADYVKKSYIATQGPLPNTIYDFWLMVFLNICKYDEQDRIQNSNGAAIKKDKMLHESIQQKIVMLTNFVENNRQKCSAYFPVNEDDFFIVTHSNEEIQSSVINEFYEQYFKKECFSNIETFKIKITDEKVVAALPKVNFFIVKNTKIIMKHGFSMRQLQCLFCCNSGDQIYNESTCNEDEKYNQIVHNFNCCHYWYPDWPDHRSPSDISVLLEISQHLLALDKMHEQPLPIIHCSAGIGRTGCMAAILNAISQIQTSFSFNSKSPSYQSQLKTNPSVDHCPRVTETESDDVNDVQSFPSQSLPSTNLDIYDSKKKFNFKFFNENLTECNVKFKDSEIFQDQNMLCETMKKNPNIRVDILGIVCNLRLQRGGMVQNSEQYELIHRAMCLYLKRVLKLLYETRI